MMIMKKAILLLMVITSTFLVNPSYANDEARALCVAACISALAIPAVGTAVAAACVASCPAVIRN